MNEEKINKLKDLLSETGSAVIALSGGTDSVFLTYIASKVKGFRLLAVTVSSPYMFTSEVKEAGEFCATHGITHKQLSMDLPEAVRNNPPERCYLCKKEVMKLIRKEADSSGIATVFDGTNADDVSDYRPGLKALKEAGIRSPLLEAGLTKSEIQLFSREAGLPTWNKPSNTCLLTRFPHGTEISSDSLRKAEAAEALLIELGFSGSRIRVHGTLARIECRKVHFESLLDEKMRCRLVDGLKKAGYEYITLDLEGYRSGSMNPNNK